MYAGCFENISGQFYLQRFFYFSLYIPIMHRRYCTSVNLNDYMSFHNQSSKNHKLWIRKFILLTPCITETWKGNFSASVALSFFFSLNLLYLMISVPQHLLKPSESVTDVRKDLRSKAIEMLRIESWFVIQWINPKQS